MRTIAALALATLLLSCPKPPPDAPSIPWGPSEGRPLLEYTFYTTATAPGGESLAYRFSWGDTTSGDWTGYYAPGETASGTSSWSVPGWFAIQVRVRTQGSRMSAWSDIMTFSVSDSANRPPNTPAKPWGLDTAWAMGEYDLMSSATDPDGDSLYYRLAWGEGNTNYWDGPVASGDTFEDGYGGLPPGLTLVSCQAKDVRGALSPWSPPCTLYLRALAAPEWRADVRSLDGVCPAVAADGTIYVTSYDGVYAVNPDGTVRWLSPARCYRSVAIAPDGTLRFVQRAGDTLPEALRALDPDGSDRWSFVLPRSVESDLAVGADGTTYFGCQDSFLYAVDSAGRLRWRTRMTARWFASIVLGADGTAYVETPDRTAAVGSDGVIEWTCQVGCRLENVVMGVGPDGTVYCGEESLTAIRPDGTVAWTQPTGSTAGTAVGPDGTIYQPSQLGLLAFDRDGSLLWTFIPANYDFDRYISGLAIVSDGTIYCSSRCGGLFLHAVDAAGRETWRGQMAGGEWWPTNPAVGPNGFVYIAGNGPLHAFRGTAPLAGSGWPKYQRDMSNSGRSGGP